MWKHEWTFTGAFFDEQTSLAGRGGVPRNSPLCFSSVSWADKQRYTLLGLWRARSIWALVSTAVTKSMTDLVSFLPVPPSWGCFPKETCVWLSFWGKCKLEWYSSNQGDGELSLTTLTCGHLVGSSRFYTKADLSGCVTFLYTGEFPRMESQR